MDETRSFTAAIREAAAHRRRVQLAGRAAANRKGRGRPAEYGPPTSESLLVGRHVRRHRLRLAMSQEVLAREAGVSLNFVAQLEDGAAILRRRHRIADVKRVLGMIE